MPADRRHRKAWTEERVARELETWFARRAFEAWPAYREFRADGRKRLYSELMRTGGPARWAPELGVPTIKWRPGGGIREPEIHAQLRALMRAQGPVRFPGLAWLARHGPPGLAATVKRTGGSADWARELGMPPPPPNRELPRSPSCSASHARRSTTSLAVATSPPVASDAAGSSSATASPRPSHPSTTPRHGVLTAHRSAQALPRSATHRARDACNAIQAGRRRGARPS